MSSSLKVVLACAFPRDEKLGSARTPLRIERELRALGVDVHGIFAEDLPSVGSGGRTAVLSAPFRLAEAVRRSARDADIVDVAGGDGWAFFRGARFRRSRPALVARSNGLWDLALAAEDRGARGFARTLVSDLYQRHLVCGYERAAIRAADMAVFLSRADADEVVRRGLRRPDGVAAVNPGVDPFFASSVPLEARRDVAFCGTFFHRKGSDIVVRVMNALLTERPELAFTIFGGGLPPAQIQAQFAAGVRDRVTVAEPLAAEALARRLEHFAICLFPTRYEGFGIVVLEAMRAGLAVVTTATGAGADLIEDGKNGLVVPIGAVEPTYAALRRLLDDTNLRTSVAAAAIHEAEGRTWQRAANELLDVYELALARSPRARGSFSHARNGSSS